jgi:concentrative nucleoside transporter, CNT family
MSIKFQNIKVQSWFDRGHGGDMGFYNLISFSGMFVLMGIAWVSSTNRRLINWRVVLWGTGLQLAFAAFIFAVPAGQKVFLLVNGLVLKLVEVAGDGAKFLFGPLAQPPGTEGSVGFILAFQALPTIVFFAALLSLLYHFGVLPRLIEWFSKLFSHWMKLSGAESLCVSANMFVGVESALTVKPYLERMTRSELCTIMTSMMGNTASSVLTFYVLILLPTFPNIAGHLVSATLLSWPAGIVMAKLMFPEEEKPETLGADVRVWYDPSGNAIESIINGATDGGKMVLGIMTLLLAVLGLVGLLNLLTTLLGGWINIALGTGVDFTLQGLLGYIFYPLTLLLGINPHDAPAVARLIGERLVLTEATAYQDLAKMLAQGQIIEKRSAILAAYALCGFAHVASLGIFIGGIASLAPTRAKDMAAVGFRALWAATLSLLMLACAAGVFLTHGSVLFGQ